MFGPESLDRRVADSNLTLLRLTVERYITFWGSADTLKSKLARMEQGLKSLMAREIGESAQSKKTPASTRNDNTPSQPNFTSPASSETVTLPYQTPGADQQLPYSAGLDPSEMGPSQSFVGNPYDFTQPFLMPDVTGFISGSTDYFPYGLEELLMYGAGTGQQPMPAQVQQ